MQIAVAGVFRFLFRLPKEQLRADGGTEGSYHDQ